MSLELLGAFRFSCFVFCAFLPDVRQVQDAVAAPVHAGYRIKPQEAPFLGGPGEKELNGSHRGCSEVAARAAEQGCG